MNKDIIQKYRLQKISSNFSLIALSLALAISINFILSDTKLGTNLKTNLQEANKTVNNSADLYMELETKWSNRVVHIKSSKDISEVKNIWLSFFYESNSIKVKDIVSDIANTDVLKLVDTNGSKTISITSNSARNIKAWDSILTIFLEKTSNKLENLNLLNTNFTDIKNNTYYLSTSWTEL